MKGRRGDGYHELETVFQTVDLTDLISLETTRGGVSLSVSEGHAPEDKTNLAYRAAEAFLKRWAPGTGVHVDLKKRIPIGGGLGGGSSNAATVLMGLDEVFGTEVDRQDLAVLASQLGADVPYFLWGGTAMGQARGDLISPLPDLPERTVWLVTPALSVSTSQVFAHLDLGQLASRSSLFGASRSELLQWDEVEIGWNDLEQTAMEHYPEIRDVYNALVETGATVVRLSGSGATLFALFESGAEMSGLATELPIGSRVFQTRTLKRSSLDRLRVVQ